MNRLTPRAFKDQNYQQLARVTKALASPQRLELVDLLAQGERSVEVLAKETGMSVANTSHHLQVLKDAGLVALAPNLAWLSLYTAVVFVFAAWRLRQKVAS